MPIPAAGGGKPRPYNLSSKLSPALLAGLLLFALATVSGASQANEPDHETSTDEETSSSDAPAEENSDAEADRETDSEADSEAAEKPLSNTIRWTTASEVDNFGFDVFRGIDADGPFERLNSEIISGAITTDEPQSYSYVDDTIDPYETYFYYVESISMSGVRELFTPIGKAKPKRQRDDG